MDKLRIGIIGLGWFGEIHAETIVGVPNLELKALCTRTEDRLQELGNKFGVKKLYRDYHDMLADPEIADVLKQGRTPEETCEILVNLALERGGKDNVTVVVARYHLEDQ